MALSSGNLAQALEALSHSPDLPKLFPVYLILLHQIIRASVPLMEAARCEAVKLASSDPVAQRLADYLARHIEEEKDHDEWLLEDLESVGLSRQQILDRIPMPTTASFVGTQYYWIYHHHPVGLLGYIWLLEGNPATPEGCDNLERRTGLPKSLFRTYRMHAELDPQHVQELDNLIDSLSLTESQMSLIGISAISASISLAECVSGIHP
jgi:pyrroloquinoline quinone (PQQ) biosynthesis protein C